MKIKNRDITKNILLLITAFCIIGMATSLVLTRFGRPIGDDYGAITTFHSRDLAHQAIVSITHTGRYSQSIASSLFYGLLGASVTRILPLLAIIWLNVISYLYIKKILQHIRYESRNIDIFSFKLSVIFSFLLLFVNNTPNYSNLLSWPSYQLFFWSSGIVTYTLAILFLVTGYYSIYLSRLSQKLQPVSQYSSLTVLVLITGLFNEAQPAIIFIFCILLYLFSYLRYFERIIKQRRKVVIGAIASLTALIGLYFSPGRLTRSKDLSKISPTSSGSLPETVLRNLHTLVHDIYFRPTELVILTLLGVVLFCIAVESSRNKHLLKNRIKLLMPYLTLAPLLLFISTVVSITLVALGYGLSAGLYSRTLLISQISYVLSIVAMAAIVCGMLYSHIKVDRATIVIRSFMIVLAFGFLFSLPRHFDKIMMQVNSSVTYYNLWNLQDSVLSVAARNNRPETIFLKDPATGIGDGFSLTCKSPNAKSLIWLNMQITQYYGGNDRVCSMPDSLAQKPGSQNVLIIPWDQKCYLL